MDKSPPPLSLAAALGFLQIDQTKVWHSGSPPCTVGSTTGVAWVQSQRECFARPSRPT